MIYKPMQLYIIKIKHNSYLLFCCNVVKVNICIINYFVCKSYANIFSRMIVTTTL